MNLKLSGKTCFYSWKTMKQNINNFNFILTFWTRILLPNFITLSNMPSNLFLLSSLSLFLNLPLSLSYIYIYVCPYECYNVSIIIYDNTEIEYK